MLKGMNGRGEGIIDEDKAPTTFYEITVQFLLHPPDPTHSVYCSAYHISIIKFIHVRYYLSPPCSEKAGIFI